MGFSVFMILLNCKVSFAPLAFLDQMKPQGWR